MIIPTCKEVTRRLAEGEFEDSPWYKRVLIHIHLAMCQHCRRFARQLKLLGLIFRTVWTGKFDANVLSSLQNRILTRLKRL